MDQELNCDFYFGDKVDSQIKIMDYNSLSGYQKTVKSKRITKYRLHWQEGIWKLIFKPYTHYIISGNTNSISNWLLLLLAIPLRKKIHAWTHGMKGISSPNGRLIEKYFYRLCTSVLLYGNFSKNIMLQEGFKEDMLIPIYNSLDYENQLKIRVGLSKSAIYREHFSNDHPVLIYIGRIQQSKKLDFLVKAQSKLWDENMPCNLVFVGADVENNNIPALVKAYGLAKNVWFYGPCYDEKEIGQLLFNADVCVSPGPVGLTALHALTYGCPVISNNDFANQMPEHEAILAGKNGDFFNNDDLLSLTYTIKNWINLSDRKRDKVRSEAYKIIDKKWNPNYQIKIFKQLLNISE